MHIAHHGTKRQKCLTTIKTIHSVVSICLHAMHSCACVYAFVKFIDALPTPTTATTATTEIFAVLKWRKKCAQNFNCNYYINFAQLNQNTEMKTTTIIAIVIAK